jgi:hypothetical protein
MERLVLTAVVVLGIIIAFAFKGFFHKGISIGLAISILLLWSDNQYIITSSFILFLILTITTFIYGLTVKGISKFEKIGIITMGLFLIINFLSKLLHFPGANIMKLSMAVPIIITLASFLKGRKLTKEMSFMVVWLFYVILEFISN